MASDGHATNGRNNDLVVSPRQRPDGNAIMAKVKLKVDRLNLEWNLRLEIPADGESPDKRHGSIEKRCVSMLKYLCFKGILDEPYGKFMTAADDRYSRWVKKPKADRGVIPERTRQHTKNHSISDLERSELLECLHKILKDAQTEWQMQIGCSPGGRRGASDTFDDSPVPLRFPTKKRRSDGQSGEASAKKMKAPNDEFFIQRNGATRAVPPPVSSNTDIRRLSMAASFTSHASSVFSGPSDKNSMILHSQSTIPDDDDVEANIKTQPNTQHSSPHLMIRPQSSEYEGGSSFEQHLKESTESLDHNGVLRNTVATFRVTEGLSPDSRARAVGTSQLELAAEILQDRLKDVFPPLPSWLKSASFRVIYEITRVFLHAHVKMNSTDFFFASIANTKDYDVLWRCLKDHPAMKEKSLPEKSSKDAWDAAASNDTKGGPRAVLLAGSLLYNIGSSKEPFFRLLLQPLKLDLTHRLSRRFGADRFLEIDMPHISGSQIPSVLKDLGETGQDLIIRWLVDSDHWLFGRSWKPFHGKPKDRKDKKQTSSAEPVADTAYRVYFFATDGAEFNPTTHPKIDIPDLLDKIRITQENMDEKYLKLFARTDLAVSKNTATVILDKPQIRYKEDILNDHEIMTDGAGRLSPNLAFKVTQRLGLSYLPSGFQARIGEAKGFWSIDYADRSEETWIEVFESQRKWKKSQLDCHNDPSDRTFEVLRYSSPLKSADLNLQFLPLLTQRATDPEQMRKVLERLLNQAIGRELSDIRNAMDHPQAFRKWLQDNSSGISDRLRNGFVPFRASLPVSTEERLNMMLDAGFDPTKLQFVKDLARIAFRNKCDTLKKKLNITVGKSTYAYMVPDFAEALEPDEVYLDFSSFTDAVSGFSGVLLNGVDVLVARSPAHYVSDIQKVKAVCKVALMGLKDVIVFSTKGSPSLAAKLSGGDYDGDIAWVCWDPEIVDNFNTVNVPTTPDLVQEGYISKDSTTYRKLVHGQSNPVSVFLKKSFKFNMQQSMLGICTEYKERICYHQKSVDTRETLYLSTLLSSLVDQGKQGYSFTNDDFTRFKLEIVKIKPRIPSYKTDHVDRKSEHVIDCLMVAAIDKVEEVLKDFSESSKSERSNPEAWDEDLVQYYRWARGMTNPQWKTLLDQLDKDIKQLKSDWGTDWALEISNRSFSLTAADEPKTEFMPRIDRFYERFQDIKPRDNTSLLAQSLLPSYMADENLSNWALLRASALFETYRWRGCNTLFPWFMAGRQFARLKVESGRGGGVPHMVAPRMFAMLKPDAVFVKRSRCLEAGDEKFLAENASVVNEAEVDNLED